MGLLSLIALVVLVWGGLSGWGYRRSWDYGSSGHIRQLFSKE